MIDLSKGSHAKDDHHEMHHLAKSSLDKLTPHLEVNFIAHSRNSNLKLKPSVETVLAQKAIIEEGGGHSVKSQLELAPK